MNGGTIQADGSAHTLANAMVLTNTCKVAGSFDLTLNGAISGTGALTKNGSGTLYLTHANSFSGATIANAGILAADYANNDGQSCVGRALLGISNGGTVRIDYSNALGTGANVPPIFINAGGKMDIAMLATQRLGSISLNGGTLASETLAGGLYGTYNLDNNLTAGGSTTTSVISALFVALTTPGGTTFTVNPGGIISGPDLDITGTIDAPLGVTNTALIKAGTGAMRFSNVNTFTAPLIINAGLVVIDHYGSIASSTVSISSNGGLIVDGSLASGAAVGNNGTLLFTANFSTTATFTRTLSTLSLGTGSATEVGASLSSLFPEILNVTSVFTLTGRLDLTNNEMTAKSSQGTIEGLLASGALYTSQGGMGTTKLGYKDLGGGVTEVRYTLAGDANLDTVVNVGDLGALATGYGISGGAVWSQGDFNYDGKVDVGDLGALATNYGTSLAAGSQVADAETLAAASDGTQSVPEPTAAAWLAGAVVLASFRRRSVART
jgi:autotransporter-associated beta strand protein